MDPTIHNEAKPWDVRRREYWASDVYRHKYKPLIHFLYRRRGRGIHGAALQAKFAFGRGRKEFGDAIEFARKMGHPLCSSPGRGYWMAQTFDEHMEWREQERGRALSYLETLSRNGRFSRLRYQVQTNMWSAHNRHMAAAK